MVRAKGRAQHADDEHQRHGRLSRCCGCCTAYSLSFGNDKFDLFGDPTQYWGLKGLIGGNAKSRGLPRIRAPGLSAADAVNIPLAGTIPQLGFRDVPADVSRSSRSRWYRARSADRLKFGAWLGLSRACGRHSFYFPGRTLGVRLRRLHR